MRRLILAICLVMVGGSGMGFAAHPALAASLCVGSGPGCYSTIQQALDKADNGDVIHIESGTYSGTTPSPIVITKSVQIIGAGAGSTTIQGGGPVVTIGTADGTSEPTVSITGVTITGGLNTSLPSPSNTRGGGILVLPSAPNQPGVMATVTNTVITGNSVAATENSCGAGCTLSVAAGGGIENFGTMRLTNTVVSNNHLMWTVASAPDTVRVLGGGIKNNGALTLQGSTVSDNTVRFQTAATLPDAVAKGGGMETAGGATLTMDGSIIRGNTVTLTTTSTDPSSAIGGSGGGVQIDSGKTTIRGSLITGNSVTATAYGGFATSNGGGIDDDSSLLLLGSTVSNNQVSTTITSTLTTPAAFTAGGGMDVDGSATIRGTTFSGNVAKTTSPAATFSFQNGNVSGTFAGGGALTVASGQTPVTTVSMTDSTVTGNQAVATSASGTAIALGGAISNGGILTLRTTTVSNNTAQANGPRSDSFAGGGGIRNDNPFGPPPAQLTLIDSTITHNSATGSPGIQLHGGGLYNGTQASVTARDSVIAQNTPDNCYPPNSIPGCSG